jgi:hypothetical protein
MFEDICMMFLDLERCNGLWSIHTLNTEDFLSSNNDLWLPAQQLIRGYEVSRDVRVCSCR